MNPPLQSQVKELKATVERLNAQIVWLQDQCLRLQTQLREAKLNGRSDLG